MLINLSLNNFVFGASSNRRSTLTRDFGVGVEDIWPPDQVELVVGMQAPVLHDGRVETLLVDVAPRTHRVGVYIDVELGHGVSVSFFVRLPAPAEVIDGFVRSSFPPSLVSYQFQLAPSSPLPGLASPLRVDHRGPKQSRCRI